MVTLTSMAATALLERRTMRELLSNLEVIGYADRLNPELVPTFVPPVFRVVGTDQVLMPPLRIVDDHVESPITGTMKDFERFIAVTGNATALDTPIPAKPKHVLWIDEHLQPRYEPKEVVQERVKQLEQEAFRQFEAARATGDFEAAQHALGLAISMSSRNALLLKADVLELQGEPELAQVAREAAGVSGS